MRSSILIPIAVVLVVVADEPGDLNKKDLERMQGGWTTLVRVVDGDKLGDDEAQVIFRTVKNDMYTVSFYDKPVDTGTFTIDAAKKPKTIDLRPASTGKDAAPLLGIYEFDGDTLRICSAGAGKERPKDFECKKGSGRSLTVWKREKK
jgi:uncharacterized protein (TIGR03067 family)